MMPLVTPRNSVVLEAEGVFAACTDVTEDKTVWMVQTNLPVILQVSYLLSCCTLAEKKNKKNVR